MIEEFKQYILKKNLCRTSDKILLALSGGMDSVVLLDLLRKSGYTVSLAHCNFQLREKESDHDEQFVRELADSKGLTVFIKKFNAKAIATERKLSIQETARMLRYEWFDQLAEENRFDYIVVAHHADDQAETFFINLFRGSGVSGLKGMPVNRGKIIRPLLFAKRVDIEKYAVENNLSYREDSSNSEDKYLRNRIRHHLMPEISRLKPAFHQALLMSLEMLGEDELLLKQLLEEKKKALFLTEKDTIRIKRNELFKLEPVRVWLYYLIRDFGFNRENSDAILDALTEERTGKTFILPGYELLIDRKQLILKKITRSSAKKSKPENELFLPVKLVPSVHAKDEMQSFSNDPGFAYFDFEKLKFPLLIRHWRKGDRFSPFGMKGSKLVSDFLIDSKLSRFEKDNVYVMLSDNEIIWVIGRRSSEDCKVSVDTRKIYQVQLIND